MGRCPCPRCYVKLADLDKMGLPSDMQSRVKNLRSYVTGTIDTVRGFIYTLGLGVASRAVERYLASQSWVPTMVSIQLSILCATAYQSLTEHICQETGSTRTGAICHARCRSHARV